MKSPVSTVSWGLAALTWATASRWIAMGVTTPKCRSVMWAMRRRPVQPGILTVWPVRVGGAKP